MYTETITLFNRYYSKVTRSSTWYPHVLHGVSLIVDKASIMARYGAETTDKASLHVKYKTDSNGAIIIDGIPYLPAHEWEKLTNDELGQYITFNSNSNSFDFFIEGEYEGPEPITDKDFFSKMEKEVPCYALTSVSSPYKLIKHFEIMAK